MIFNSVFNLSNNIHSPGLPLLVTPSDGLHSGLSKIPHGWKGIHEHFQQIVKECLPKYGGILFRGFQNYGDETSCKEFAQLFSKELVSYEFGSTPRTDLGDGVYSATEYPAHQHIPLHNEQAYTLQWPLKIWFHCVRKAETGGETPLADSRKIYQSIPHHIRHRFEQKQLMYVRNYGNGLDLPWEKVFNTNNRQVVESFCRQNHIRFEWKEEGELRTRQNCQASAQHPDSGEWVWFNQAHLFHISNVEHEAREALLDIVEVEDLPRNVYYGDGSPIEDSILDEIREVLAEQSVPLSWQEGDFLMLDNMLMAHGRTAFTGDRKVVVAMSDSFDSTLMPAQFRFQKVG